MDDQGYDNVPTTTATVTVKRLESVDVDGTTYAVLSGVVVVGGTTYTIPTVTVTTVETIEEHPVTIFPGAAYTTAIGASTGISPPPPPPPPPPLPPKASTLIFCYYAEWECSSGSVDDCTGFEEAAYYWFWDDGSSTCWDAYSKSSFIAMDVDNSHSNPSDEDSQYPFPEAEIDMHSI
ncbi:hypothetical protein F5884DRAFT_815142 [Xylogone sp. PMI_703]|nr:hypothetical protein F5884DRAFT_815142 [Xylogone sp. PMI_703]